MNRNTQQKITRWLERNAYVFGRISFFIIFVWFGLLKVLSMSPAEPLVVALAEKTLFGINPVLFNYVFGIFEVVLGVLFLFPKLRKITFVILLGHLCATVLPLFVLPDMSWTTIMVPTLVGQYIIKNLVLLSLAIILVFGKQEQNKKI